MVIRNHPNNDDSPCECGLRELKRRRTRRSIESAAVELALDGGYDTVTVDAICAAAEISKRTFFNYYESKDQAIFGPGTITSSADVLRSFGQKDSPEPVRAMINLLDELVARRPSEDDDLDDPKAWQLELRRKRRAIFRNSPTLAVKTATGMHAALKLVYSAFREFFENYPERISVSSRSPAQEATLATGIIREAVIYSAIHIDDLYAQPPFATAISIIREFTGRI